MDKTSLICYNKYNISGAFLEKGELLLSEKRRDSKGRILKTGESQRKDGRYQFRFTDRLGNRHCVYDWTLEGLRKQEDDIQRDMLDGIDYAAGDITVVELAETSLRLRQGKLKKNTRRTYQNALSRIKTDSFCLRKIRDVKLSNAKNWFLELHESGLKRSTIGALQCVLRPAFAMAVEDDAIRKNPFDFSLASLIPNDAVERVALTPEQERDYLSFIEGYEHLGYNDDVIILLRTGLRVSELYGLTGKDVDFENMVIHINKQLCRDSVNKYYIESPKSRQGTRDIPMTTEVSEAFRRVIRNRRTPKVERVIDGCAGFLFLTKTGLPKVAIHLETFMGKMLRKYAEQYGKALPNITPHTLRHTFSTRMYNAGVDLKSLQYLMGHSKPDLTLGTYTHTDYATVEKAVRRAVESA